MRPADLLPREYGLVNAAAARRHLLALSRQGVGRRSYCRSERRRGISHRLYPIAAAAADPEGDGKRRLLAVDVGCASDRALVSSTTALAQIGRLLADGYSARQLATFLGYTRNGLQFIPGRRMSG